MYCWETLSLLSIVKAKPGGEVLMEATVPFLRVDGIRVNVFRGTVVLQRMLCDMVSSVLPDWGGNCI